MVASASVASTVAAAAHDVRFPEVSVPAVPVVSAASFLAFTAAAAAVAALVVMVVVPFLLALDAHVRHDHLGAVPYGHAVPGIVPAPVGRQVLPGSVDKKSTVGEKRPVRESEIWVVGLAFG